MASDARKILLVEDEKAIRDAVAAYLEREGYWVVGVGDGQSAVEEFEKHQFDLIVLDLMLPKLSGERVCRAIRDTSDVPIIMLTAKGEVEDRIIGLELGADDYLTKPFRVAELRARVAAHLRRQNRTPSHKITRGGVTLDLSAKEAGVGGMPLHLTKSEYAICELLALHAGQTFSKEQIYEAVFGYDGTADDTAITQHIKNIRAKLRAAGVGEVLQTIWGVGYQWQNEN
jgi:DNA-binding response OmpR family regulator